jgi:hypothetical protein
MKKLRNLIAVMAMMSMAAVLTGCGDDDDDDDDDGGPTGPTIVAPTTVEELTAANRVYTVTVPGDTNQLVLTFPAAGQYRAEQGGGVETGTIASATRSDNTWTLTTAPDAASEGAVPGVAQLAFTSGTEGTWTFTPDGGTAETGTFVVTIPGGGDPGGDTGGGNAPASLDGRRIQLQNVTGGSGQELLTFSGANSGTFTSDAANPPATGTFTYTATGDTAELDLQFDTPAAFADDFYDLTLTFASDTAGTFSGNQHIGGSDNQTTGNFSMP